MALCWHSITRINVLRLCSDEKIRVRCLAAIFFSSDRSPICPIYPGLRIQVKLTRKQSDAGRKTLGCPANADDCFSSALVLLFVNKGRSYCLCACLVDCLVNMRWRNIPDVNHLLSCLVLLISAADISHHALVFFVFVRFFSPVCFFAFSIEALHNFRKFTENQSNCLAWKIGL